MYLSITHERQALAVLLLHISSSLFGKSPVSDLNTAYVALGEAKQFHAP